MKTRSQTKSTNTETSGPTIYELTVPSELPIYEPDGPVYNGEIKNAIYDVVIDFDDASRCWTSNKRRLKNGCYQYICGAELKNGNKCQRKPMSGIDSDSFACSLHHK